MLFNGLDAPPAPGVPDFVKALDVEQALDPDILLAYEMNGEPLPWLNGFPLRLVVPGHYGTYWVKHLHEITVVDEQFKGFWMDPRTHSGHRVRCHRARHRAEKDRADHALQRAFLHHEPRRWCEAPRRCAADCQRHRVRRRARNPRSAFQQQWRAFVARDAAR